MHALVLTRITIVVLFGLLKMERVKTITECKENLQTLNLSTTKAEYLISN